MKLTKQQALEKIEELENYICQIDKPKRWKPKAGQMYFGIVIEGSMPMFTSLWSDDETDNFRYSMGNCYQTEEEAQKAKNTGWIAKLQAEVRIEDYILENGLDNDMDWEDKSQEKHAIYYDYLNVCFKRTSFYSYCKENPYSLYFSNEADRNNLLENCEEDLKILWGVK